MSFGGTLFSLYIREIMYYNLEILRNGISRYGQEALMDFKLTLNINAGNGTGGGFGPGLVQLLEGVGETGSLNASAHGMKMAYSKAWRLVREAEAEFGFQLLLRSGAKGSALTDEAKKLIACFRDMQQAARKEAEKVFTGYYGTAAP